MPTTVTSTIRSSGGDYTSLSAWEAGEQGNLVTADEIRVAECYDDWPSGLSDNLTIDGSTTDSTRYFKITVASGHRHNGTPQSGFFLKKSVNSGYLFRVDDNYTRIEWIDAENSGSADSFLFYITERQCTLDRCIGKTAVSTAFFVTHLVEVRCCLAYGSLVGFRNDYVNPKFYNCVAAGCGTGFYDYGNGATIKNCVAYSNTTNYSGSSWDASSGYNATSTGSDDAPGGNSVYSVSSSAFVNAASNDFHLASGSVLIGAGTNLYSTFTTDIDGDTWPSSGAWDIGFDYRTGGAAATSISFSPRFPRAILNF